MDSRLTNFTLPDAQKYPVINRFFVAIFHYIAVEDLRGFKTFCDLYGFDRPMLNRLAKEPHRQFHPEWLTVLVEKCGYSAEWLLTGKGEMRRPAKERNMKVGIGC